MNWRRGILLAAINLAVAVPLIVSLEVADAAYVRNYYVSSKPVETPPPVSTQATDTKNEGVSFSPCAMLIHNPAQQEAENSTNMPAVFSLTGWRSPCPAPWQLSGIFHANGWATPTPSFLIAQRKVDIGLLLLIPIQWLLVGAFPLSSSRRTWREPGAFITGCAILAVGLVFIHPIEELARLPALFATVAWFWWLGLLVWKIARSTWKWTARHLAQAGA